MTVKYLEIPIADYGSIKVAIEPTRAEDLSETLGVVDMEALHESRFEDLGDSGNRFVETGIAVAASAFDELSATLYALGLGFHDIFARLQPDEASIELGVCFSGEAGVVLKATGEASLKVTLGWKAPEVKGTDAD